MLADHADNHDGLILSAHTADADEERLLHQKTRLMK
jgi:hypothetical protein